MSLVTVSAPYGCGGSQIGPALAQRLGVPFVDRAISVEVAARLAVPLADVFSREHTAGSVLDRVLASLAPMAQAFGAGETTPEPVAERSLRDAAEGIVLERAAGGQAVILGHAAAVVLRDDRRALHVRLDAPREARLAQAMRIQAIDRPTAERRMAETDRARYAFVRRHHGADARDPDLYHLLIDSTAIDLTACVEMIVLAARSRAACFESETSRV